MTIKPVFSPELSIRTRDALRAAPGVLIPRDDPPAKRSDFLSRNRGRAARIILLGTQIILIGAAGLCLLTAMLSLVIGGSTGETVTTWALVGIGIISALAFLALLYYVLAEPRNWRRARLNRGRYLTSDDFDAAAGTLLARAQGATEIVLSSDAHMCGWLDETTDNVVIPRELWGIAKSLHRQTTLRAHQSAARSGRVGDALNSVLEPQRNALKLSIDATTKRVEALERYADAVAEADAAYHEQLNLRDALIRNEDYRGLVAHTSAQASPRPRGLAKESQRLEAALQHAIDQAIEAGRALSILPRTPDS